MTDSQAQDGSEMESVPDASSPPWGDDFNAEKAWGLVTHLRGREKELQARERELAQNQITPEAKTKLAEYDQLVAASQTELEKAQAAAGRVVPLEAENLRLKVAIEKGLIGERANLVDRLKGETLDDLRADADSLLALFPTAATLPRPHPAQGASGSAPLETGAPQLTRSDLSRMTPDQIAEARAAGQLNDILGVR